VIGSVLRDEIYVLVRLIFWDNYQIGWHFMVKYQRYIYDAEESDFVLFLWGEWLDE